MKKGKRKLSKKKQQLMRKRIVRYLLISLALICLLLVTFFTYNTYSLWVSTHSQSSSNIITTGCFELEINDLDENNKSTAINLENTYPMTEEKGLMTRPYLLNITNICDVPSEYVIILNEFNTSSLDNSFLRYHIKKKEENSVSNLLSLAPIYSLDESIKVDIETSQKLLINRSYKLANGYLNKNESVLYELRMWLDYAATNDAMNKSFEAGVTVLSTSPQ